MQISPALRTLAVSVEIGLSVFGTVTARNSKMTVIIRLWATLGERRSLKVVLSQSQANATQPKDIGPPVTSIAA